MAENTLKIMSALDEFQRRIDGKNTFPFSNQVLVKKSEFVDLIETIRQYLPEEVERCQLMMNEITTIKLRTETAAQEHLKDAEREAKSIIEDAKAKAEEIMAKAGKIADEMVSQNNITLRAKEQSNDILARAKSDAKMTMENAYRTSMNYLQIAFNDVEHARMQLQRTMNALEEKATRNRQ